MNDVGALAAMIYGRLIEFALARAEAGRPADINLMDGRAFEPAPQPTRQASSAS